MPEDYIDCPEMAANDPIAPYHRKRSDDPVSQIELTDGTSFTCYVSVRPNVEPPYIRWVGRGNNTSRYEL